MEHQHVDTHSRRMAPACCGNHSLVFLAYAAFYKNEWRPDQRYACSTDFISDRDRGDRRERLEAFGDVQLSTVWSLVHGQLEAETEKCEREQLRMLAPTPYNTYFNHTYAFALGRHAILPAKEEVSAWSLRQFGVYTAGALSIGNLHRVLWHLGAFQRRFQQTYSRELFWELPMWAAISCKQSLVLGYIATQQRYRLTEHLLDDDPTSIGKVAPAAALACFADWPSWPPEDLTALLVAAAEAANVALFEAVMRDFDNTTWYRATDDQLLAVGHAVARGCNLNIVKAVNGRITPFPWSDVLEIAALQRNGPLCRFLLDGTKDVFSAMQKPAVVRVVANEYYDKEQALARARNTDVSEDRYTLAVIAAAVGDEPTFRVCIFVAVGTNYHHILAAAILNEHVHIVRAFAENFCDAYDRSVMLQAAMTIAVENDKPLTIFMLIDELHATADSLIGAYAEAAKCSDFVTMKRCQSVQRAMERGGSYNTESGRKRKREDVPEETQE